jgi:hypothetical protein
VSGGATPTPTPGYGGTLTISSSAGTSNLPLNTQITLTATPSTTLGTVTYAYTLQYAAGQTPLQGINISGNGSNIATITSAVSTTATILVNAYSTSTGAVMASGQITLGFGTTTTTTGTFSISASPSTAVAVGTPVIITAVPNGALTGSLTFTSSTLPSGMSLAYASATSASLTSTVPGSVVVTVTGIVNGVQATGTITIQFYSNGGGTTGTLTCQLGHLVGTYFVGREVDFGIQTNTGEPVEVTSWDSGEPWVVQPPYPVRPTLRVVYSQPGYKQVRILARSAVSGQVCNGGQYLNDLICVNSGIYGGFACGY